MIAYQYATLAIGGYISDSVNQNMYTALLAWDVTPELFHLLIRQMWPYTVISQI